MNKIFYCLILFVFLIGCMSAPDRKNYECEECYLAADCMYRNKDNPDKSVCSEHNKACTDAMKEKRIKQRLEYCRDCKFDGMSEGECRLYLNQK
jgi:hypothetical protein